MMDYIRSLLSFIFAISVMYTLLDCEIKYKKHRYLLGLYVAVVLVLTFADDRNKIPIFHC